MPTSAPGSRQISGFTLLELLVVISIIAIASAGVAFAIRDNSQTALEREGQRLAALLEGGRALSRTSGQALRWRDTQDGFRFEGLNADRLPRNWLQPGITVQWPPTTLATGRMLSLGPEPIIEPQSVVLAQDGRSLRVSTDGLRPFAVQANPLTMARATRIARAAASGGFTLIEVLVALAIVAIALAAGVQASSALVHNAQRQSDTLLAQLCAENELVKMRLARQMPGAGDIASTCEQAGRSFGVTLSVYPTPNPSFRRIEARVRNGTDASATPLLTVATVVGRY